MDQRKFKNKVIEAGSESMLYILFLVTKRCLFLNIGQDDVLSHIDSKFLPKKTKENEDNADRIQSSGSMANRVMEKKNIPPAKNILTEKIFQENSNRQKQMQQQKTKKRKHVNDDDGGR
jgi:hypothetical protein